ncbi:MAG: hypothetical protein AAGG09_01235 [Pseudomonadota bacterium]
MFRGLVLAAMGVSIAGGAHAALIDFETLPDGSIPTEGFVTQPLEYEFGTGPEANKLTFTSDSGIGIAEVGGPTFGFFPFDTPAPSDAFGDFFLTTALSQVSDLTITYETAITALNFDLGDVDRNRADSTVEEFTVIFRDEGGNALETFFIDGNDPLAGDQSVVNVSFESTEANIKSVFIEGTTAGGTRLIGIAFDNFDPDDPAPPPVIPLPGTLPLAAAGLGALLVLRRRRKSI